MSLGNDLTPVVREETILNGGDITPATRLEWFLSKAAEGGGGGGGGTVYSPVLAQTTKSVASHWVSSFAGGPILENANYRVIVNGTTYEPLTGTAGEDGYICLGNTYVADSDPSGDYSFGIFYKDGNLAAWLETGDSMTMQIDQIIQAVPVPTPTAADTGKVLTANNGAVEWSGGGASALWDFEVTITQTYDDISGDYVYSASLSPADYFTIQRALELKGEIWNKCLLHFIDEYETTHNSIHTYNTIFGGIPITPIGYSIVIENIYPDLSVQEYVIKENGVTLTIYNLMADTSTGDIMWTPNF